MQLYEFEDITWTRIELLGGFEYNKSLPVSYRIHVVTYDDILTALIGDKRSRFAGRAASGSEDPCLTLSAIGVAGAGDLGFLYRTRLPFCNDPGVGFTHLLLKLLFSSFKSSFLLRAPCLFSSALIFLHSLLAKSSRNDLIPSLGGSFSSTYTNNANSFKSLISYSY